MKCPFDEVELSMTDRQGIEIDYCPKCRGVWLDRGELDKIIERSTTNPSNENRAVDTNQPRYQEQQPTRKGHENNYDDRQYGKKRKKEGFLGDLFDF